MVKINKHCRLFTIFFQQKVKVHFVPHRTLIVRYCTGKAMMRKKDFCWTERVLFVTMWWNSFATYSNVINNLISSPLIDVKEVHASYVEFVYELLKIKKGTILCVYVYCEFVSNLFDKVNNLATETKLDRKIFIFVAFDTPIV